MYHCVFLEKSFLVIEIYKCLGPSIISYLNKLQTTSKKTKKVDQSFIFSKRVLTIFNKHMVPKAEHQVHKQKQFRDEQLTSTIVLDRGLQLWHPTPKN